MNTHASFVDESTRETPAVSFTEEELEAEIERHREWFFKNGFRGSVFGTETLSVLLGVPDSKALRKRWSRGQYPFLTKDGDRIVGLALDVARHLAKKALRSRALAQAFNSENDYAGPPR